MWSKCEVAECYMIRGEIPYYLSWIVYGHIPESSKCIRRKEGVVTDTFQKVQNVSVEKRA